MSQGYIGYDLQNAIRAELISRGIYKPIATVLTQVVIDPYDDAFAEPEKIIGRVLTEEEAEAEEDKGNFVTKISENGYRRILASPKPQRIIELETIRTLTDAGQIVIAAGGGGIPVMEQELSFTEPALLSKGPGKRTACGGTRCRYTPHPYQRRKGQPESRHR